MWQLAPFGPMISVDGDNFYDFIITWMDILSSKEAFTPGRCNSIFGNGLSFRVKIWFYQTS